MTFIQPVAALLLIAGSILMLRLVWLSDVTPPLEEAAALLPTEASYDEDYRQAA